MIKIQELSVGVSGGPRILHNLDAVITKGTFHAICGANGCGKTTLLRALCGLIAPQSGSINFDHLAMAQMSERDRAKIISWVPAEQAMSFNYSVHEVVTWGRWIHHGGLPNRHDQKHVDRALDAMKIAAFKYRKINELSLGEQKRVHLARAISADTPYIILDEPCGPLDAGVTLEVMDWINQATRDQGKTIVASLHDLPLIANFANTVTLMSQGAILAHGKTSEILTDQHLQAGLGIRMRQVSTDEGKLILLVREN